MSKKDLFDDSTMSFGEHLEALRHHLWKAIIGLVIGTVAAFFFSNYVIVAIQRPVTAAMQDSFEKPEGTIEKSQWESLQESWAKFKTWIAGLFSKSENPGPAVVEKKADPALV